MKPLRSSRSNPDLAAIEAIARLSRIIREQEAAIHEYEWRLGQCRCGRVWLRVAEPAA